MRLPARSPPNSCIAFFGLRSTAQMSLAARVTAGTTLPRIFGMNSTMPITVTTITMTHRLVLLDELLLGVDRGRGDGGGAEEQRHLDGAADAGAEHHGAAARCHRHALLVQVVELQGGTADSVRGDQVQEAARELGQHRRDERQVLVHAAEERGGPRRSARAGTSRARAPPNPRSRSRTRSGPTPS